MILKILLEDDTDLSYDLPLTACRAIHALVVGMWGRNLYVLDGRAFRVGTQSAIAGPVSEGEWTLSWIDASGNQQGPIMVSVEVLEEFPHPSTVAVSP